MFENCYCGSGLKYSKCCKPYITGKKIAPTPEALMRSRYTAYVIHAIDYIVDTCVDEPSKVNRKGITEWSENSKWLGLEIIRCSEIKENDTAAIVEFKAYYARLQLKRTHHESAKFLFRNNRWLYWEGSIISEPVTHDGAKIGRNDPCPCESGKKFKHCCGR